MRAPVVIGVRHHSPACARLVERKIQELKPRFVLIEGPCDMNGRLGELALGHKLPIALYSYRLSNDGARARGAWAPFCDYSPEWIALRRGAEVGAEVRFIDLPTWDRAFDETENRYSDRHLVVSDRVSEVANELGFDSTDALWEHLFEQPKPIPELERDLSRYFEMLRGEEEARAGDQHREAWMARWMAWAASEAKDAPVLVVCGGYHKPALERLWKTADSSAPTIPESAERVGTYLVPFSFRRLDSFAGYASGMPSPAYYQALWELADRAPEVMRTRAVKRLREKKQLVSTADVTAAAQLTDGLALLRGHAVPSRTDVLDGLASALVKEALDKPLPWSRRSPLARGTNPALVEIVAEFAGEARGELAAGTPRPPLLDDVKEELARVGLALEKNARTVTLALDEETSLARREVLYRLAVLDIPGVQLSAPVALRRGASRFEEGWTLQAQLETEPALIERAVYGATLWQAARARLLERVSQLEAASGLIPALEHALIAGFQDLAAELSQRALASIERELHLGALGAALDRLEGIAEGRPAFDAKGGMSLEPLAEAAFARALWLLEGMDGQSAPFTAVDARAVRTLASMVQHRKMISDVEAAAGLELFSRRARDLNAPHGLRGACVGAVWRCRASDAEEMTRLAIAAIRSVPSAALGDFLLGMLVLAREEVLASTVVGVVDARFRALDDEEFLRALPALREAFTFFTPAERLNVARRVLSLTDSKTISPSDLVEQAPATVEQLRRAQERQARLFELIERYGLLKA